MKKTALIFAAILLSLSAMAQGFTGGIKAGVVNRVGRVPIAGAQVELFQDGMKLAESRTAADGKFIFENMADGRYSLNVKAEGFTPTQINVIVEQGLMRDLMFVTMTAEQVNEVDDSSFAEFDMVDTGYSDTPTILFDSNDPYTNVAGYAFSSIRFKNRGYNSETQDVLLAGVKMNDAITGYSPFSLWSGLNEAMRSKESTDGLASSDYAAGGYNGVTNIMAVPSSVRPGWRFSVLSNSALYRLRLMANYASGQLDNGWSYAFNASARLGGNDWVDGVYYKSFALYAGAEKKFNDEHRLAMFAFATPGERGAQNASTQEVYNLMGDNMYNSNWGYQAGRVRNSRVRRTFEPVVALKYDYTPSQELNASATLLYRGGQNGYTALDWYDSADPPPDYYRNLPSYYYMEDEDYNRVNEEKAEWASYAWSTHTPAFARYQHLDWDHLYNINRNSVDTRYSIERRSKYVLEERHVDQNDLNLALRAKWTGWEVSEIVGGLNFRLNCTENYKKINDLLGGEYYVNVDNFAERDFASNEAKVQNDLDYYLANGHAELVRKGGKYGYDYLAQVRKANAWVNLKSSVGNFSIRRSYTVGYESFWREGLLRKGLFAGLDDEGNEIEVNGHVLTNYDAKGNVITSKGRSAVSRFLTGSAKYNIEYIIGGAHRIYANMGYFSEAPTFNQAFVSARTRNTIIDGLTNRNTFAADINYQLNLNGYALRVTGYWSKIMNQTDVMSFYDDSQNSFTNFAMSGIDERHAGIEAGFKVPLFVQGLSVSGVVSWGENIYTSTPHMIQTVDNSAEIVRDEDVYFWKESYIYKHHIEVDNSGRSVKVYERDANGKPIYLGKQKHHVPSTPELAAQLGLNYRTRSYWFFELNGQYFANSYLDMNPLYRTAFACRGGDEDRTIIDYMASQEKFDPAFLLNASIGKSWYINRQYNFGFSLQMNNILNNRGVRTGGYEQTRLISSVGKDRYYRFDPKYFYMCGANYMLNLYFRF